jgi:hypothetical protein
MLVANLKRHCPDAIAIFLDQGCKLFRTPSAGDHAVTRLECGLRDVASQAVASPCD